MQNYNFSGLIWPIWTYGSIFLLGVIISLLLSQFWRPGNIKIKELVFAALFMLAAIGVFANYAGKINDAKVETFEGTFNDFHNENRTAPFTTAYKFSNSSGEIQWCYLDTISRRWGVWPEKGGVWPEDFEEEVGYRIYYEVSTQIIVKVEKLE